MTTDEMFQEDDLYWMAKQAGFETHDIVSNYYQQLKTFASVVAQREREECARIAELRATVQGDSRAAESIAWAIRRRT